MITLKKLQTENVFVDQNASGLDLSNAMLSEKEFDTCHFEDCRLSQAQLNRCRFMDCTFTNCDLSAAAVPDATFQEVQFTSSKLIGIAWDQAASTLGFDVHFEDCALNYGVFSGMNLSGVELIRCRALELALNGATLKGITIQDSDLTRSDFTGADLRNADLSGARLSLTPEACRLGNTKLSLESALATLATIGIDVP